jgi:hypothetical protein
VEVWLLLLRTTGSREKDLDIINCRTGIVFGRS